MQLKGIIAYPITPFRADDGGVDAPTLGRLIDQLIETGADAIAPLGSTGEFAYLSDAEWDEVAEVSIQQVGRRVPTIVGVSALTTRSALRRAKFAEAAGADAIMMMAMSYWKLSEREIVGYYTEIARSVSIPIMLYNNPATSGVDLPAELIARLVREIDNVTMVKESTGDVQRMHRLHQLSEGTIRFYNGSNPLALAAFVAGASGWCTAAPNLIPEWTRAFYQAIAAGDVPRARDLFYKQLSLLQFIVKGGLPTTIKAGLKLKGFDAGAPRAPLTPLGTEGTEELRRILDGLSGSP